MEYDTFSMVSLWYQSISSMVFSYMFNVNSYAITVMYFCFVPFDFPSFLFHHRIL